MAAWTASSEVSTSWTLFPEWRMRSSSVGGAACGGAECAVYGGAGEHGVKSASVRVPAPENKNKVQTPATLGDIT